MNHLCQLVCELFFCAVYRAALKLCIFGNLFERHECEHLHALDNIGIVDISPVLEEIVGCRLFRVEPNGTVCRFAHLFALAVHEQVDGERICVLARLFADKVCSEKHIRPLVVAAELHIAAVVLMQVVEVI